MRRLFYDLDAGVRNKVTNGRNRGKCKDFHPRNEQKQEYYLKKQFSKLIKDVRVA